MANVNLMKVNPTLRADDIKALAEWYRDAMGFDVLFLWGEPASDATVRRGGIEFGIALREAAFGPISAYAHVQGIDGLYEEWQARKVTTSRTPTNQPYGMRDFDVTDPAGNRICFGEALEEGDTA